jgi:hypothetical protein
MWVKSPVSVFSKFWTGKSGLGMLLAVLIAAISIAHPPAPEGEIRPVFSLLRALSTLSGVAAAGGTCRGAGRVGAALALG